MATTPSTPQNGWLKLFYRFKEWEWYSDTNMVRLFIHLLLSANYRPLKWRGIEIPRGSLVASRATLASETNLTEQEVRTCLKRLISTNEITTKSTNKFTIITICKFENYQSEQGEQNEATNKQDNQQATNKQPTTNHQLTTSKEYKNIIKYFVVANYAREEFLAEFFKPENQVTLEAICMNSSTDIATLQRLANEVLDDWQATDEPMHHDLSQAKRHLLSQIRIKLNIERREQAAEKKQIAKPASPNRQSDKAPRRVNDQWSDFEIPTE